MFAAGLMLMWACDLIVAAENAYFADVVGTRLGMCGVEYFGHPWEFGPRKAKELLLTGDAIDVEEAHRLGMVSKIFPTGELSEKTLEFARRIAKTPTMPALLIKQAVNQTVDNMGFYNSLQRLLHPARAQPLPLGPGPREQGPGGDARRRRGRLEEPAAGAGDGARGGRGTAHQDRQVRQGLIGPGQICPAQLGPGRALRVAQAVRCTGTLA